jgi:hypothetical protein
MEDGYESLEVYNTEIYSSEELKKFYQFVQDFFWVGKTVHFTK